MYKSRFAFDRLRVANPFCNAFVSQVQLLCHKSITRASHRQGVLRNFSGQKCKKFKNRSVQNRNTSATASGSVPFSRYACVALQVHFLGSATHFCSFAHLSLKSPTYQNCISLHSYSFDCILCISRFSRTQKKDTAPCISAKRGARVSIGFRSVHLFQSLLQVLCDLVRAAGVAEPAQRTVQTCNDVLGLHAGDQLADAFQVAVAAADDLDGRNGVVVAFCHSLKNALI